MNAIPEIVTPEMIHEMEAHLPYDVREPHRRWQWTAEFLNRAIAHPGVPCPCCGVAQNGELFDHMTGQQRAALQPDAGDPREPTGH